MHGTTVLESFKQEMQRGEEEVRSLQSAVHSAAFEAFDTSSTKEQLESQDRTQEEQSSVAVEDVAVIENEHDGFTPDVPSGEEAHMDGRAVLPPSQESVSGGMTDNFSGEDATIHLEETGVRTNNHDGEGDTSRGMAMDDPTGVDTETTHSGNQNGENLVAHSGEALSGASSVSLSGPEGITKGSDPDEAESEVDVSPNVNSSTPKAELNLTDQIIGEYVDDNTGQGTASLLDSPSGGANNSDHSSGAGSDIALTAVVGANRLMHMGVNIDTIQNIDWNGTRGGEVMLDGDVLLKPDASVSSGGRSSGSNNTVGAAVTGDTWLDLNTTADASGNSNSTSTGELEFRIMTEDLAEDPDEGALNDTHSLAGAGDLKDNDTGSCKTTANVRATEVALGDNITNSKDQDSPDGIAPDSILGDVQRNSYTVSDVRILQSNVSDAAVPATASVFAPMTAGLSSNSASDGVHPLSPPSVVNASLVDANKELPEFGMDTSSGNGTTKITSENVIVTGYGNEVRNESSTGVVEDLTPQVLKDMYNQLTNATSGFAVANLSTVNNSNVPMNASLAASPCIDILKFSAFQAKMIAKLNLPPNFMDSSNIFTSTHSNPSLHHDGKNLNENVFRTLMQRIKSLEMKYAIIEKYASQVTLWNDGYVSYCSCVDVALYNIAIL